MIELLKPIDNQKECDNIRRQLIKDIVSDFEYRIGLQDKLLKQAIAFREECVAKGLISLIPDTDKKIDYFREDIAWLSENVIQGIESL